MEFLILCITAIVLSEIYVWYAHIRHRKLIWKILYWIPYVILMLVITWMSISHLTVWKVYTITGLMAAVFGPFCVFTLFSLISRVVRRFSYEAAKWVVRTGVAACLVVSAAGIYGLLYGWRRIVVKEIPVAFENLPPAFKGYKIVQISDLHIGTYGSSPATVTNIVDKVNAANPDLILFTGDIINIYPEEVKPFVDELRRLSAKDGVYSVMGNHDYCGYAPYETEEEIVEAIERLQKFEKDAGFTLLKDSNVVIRHGADSLSLIGVEYIGEPPFPLVGDLDKAMSGLPDGIFKILMSHDPNHWHNRVMPYENIDFTLSGHTHAMQFKIAGFSPAQFLFEEWGGLYNKNGKKLFVNTGTGSNIPFRLGAWPEIDIIVLQDK